ncbi:hypothetical protein [Pectobacterium sp. A5351]|uniref:hypothetical protein n=1 Tax=Pectobacterium sp. A5351 TaxID=2914983 RepID=UPI003FA74A58
MGQNKKSGTLSARQPEVLSSATVLNVWLGSLAPSGRRSMRSLLNLSAGILKRGVDAEDYDWAGCAIFMSRRFEQPYWIAGMGSYEEAGI